MTTVMYGAYMGKQAKTKMGRPPLPKGKVKDTQLVFRVDPSLRRKIVRAAKRAHKPMATWIRDMLTELLSGGK